MLPSVCFRLPRVGVLILNESLNPTLQQWTKPPCLYSCVVLTNLFKMLIFLPYAYHFSPSYVRVFVTGIKRFIVKFYLGLTFLHKRVMKGDGEF